MLVSLRALYQHGQTRPTTRATHRFAARPIFCVAALPRSRAAASHGCAARVGNPERREWPGGGAADIAVARGRPSRHLLNDRCWDTGGSIGCPSTSRADAPRTDRYADAITTQIVAQIVQTRAETISPQKSDARLGRLSLVKHLLEADQTRNLVADQAPLLAPHRSVYSIPPSECLSNRSPNSKDSPTH